MRKATIAVLSAALGLAAFASPAFATNGYFSHGYGTHYKGMAGAGGQARPRRDRDRRPAVVQGGEHRQLR